MFPTFLNNIFFINYLIFFWCLKMQAYKTEPCNWYLNFCWYDFKALRYIYDADMDNGCILGMQINLLYHHALFSVVEMPE